MFERFPLDENIFLENYQTEGVILMGDRSTKIREYDSNLIESGACFEVANGLGIRVFTDSEKLANEIKEVFGGISVNSSYTDFVHLTKKDTYPVDIDGLLLRSIGLGVLGDPCY